VYLIAEGAVKLYSCSTEGKVVILGITYPGDLLGVSAMVEGRDYEVTAEAIDQSRVYALPSARLRALMEANAEFAVGIARQLSRYYQMAYRQICSLALPESVRARLAGLILEWCKPDSDCGGPLHIRNSLTHEEIAGMIGTTRETVTRALRDLRENGLVTLKGSDLIIHNLEALRSRAGRGRPD
jgi:CRP/FNR family transcriptional regulator